MTNSTITLELPRMYFVTTSTGPVAVQTPSRLDQIVARQQTSQLVSRLFALGITAAAVLFALGIAA